ncbi:hypothetical protein DOTSEDRAFT_130097 [Dothistroma septosporum NZE10]|uniref:Uncharacterized protein n=1 Tax=Dothistroma septosporum (strain NZE10 / CBS 128990) TaxID=675120 RepID=N1PLP3_DOTSN|nr:hypothetical protein DOTSEDRAFT_130097 [Dothistroma septosporum NZE10]
MDQDAREHNRLTTVPPPTVLREIERKQAECRRVILERRRQQDRNLDDEAKAARVIQRNYRGHRERRALKGYGLDPSTRWLEV